MTLTLADLSELRRREIEGPALVQPPANFLQDLPAYMAKVQQEAGPDPHFWQTGCEAFAAMGILEDIFRMRRQKILVAASFNDPPNPRSMFVFESNAWFGLRRSLEELEKGARAVAMGVRS